LNIVDSSGWLEFFIGGPNAEVFAPLVSEVESLIVPTITVYEVFKQIARRSNDFEATQFTSLMLKGEVADLDTATSIDAARLSVENRLGMADSIILATARFYEAILWTQDSDFAGIDGVEYIPAKG
jgi:predicted nucleic acid-binding protein